ncbi:unnamed protein product [Symbiodinium natans]|uniref:Uncharacterized protein n=1 Tax=Symbiodinium natans TaxID=878477 RepID=A0A812SZ72_9DINO|nr:unnamed protein product [Symbiodinium natans]
MAQRRRLSRKTSPKEVRLSLLTSLPCEKLLLPFLPAKDLLRYAAACSTCHASAHHGDRLQLSRVAHFPARLSPAAAESLPRRLHLASLYSIDIEDTREGSSSAAHPARQLAQTAPWESDVLASDGDMKPLAEHPLWRFMVGLNQQLAFARQFRSISTALLPKLCTVNLLSLQPCLGTCVVDRHDLLEPMVATLLWEAPRLEQLQLPRCCPLQPQKLQKALRQHPDRAALSRALCGWLPPDSTSSMQTAHLLDAMVIESPEDAFLAGQFARSLTRIKQLIAIRTLAPQALPSNDILKAFADGYCAADTTVPPQTQELVVNAQALAGAGPALAQLVSEMPGLRSLRLLTEAHPFRQAASLLRASSPVAHACGQQEFSQLTRIQIRGGFSFDSLNLAAMLSSASSLQVLDLSGSEFADADAQLLAAANVGPLPQLHLLGFRACKLQSPAAAAALARAVNHFGSVKHIRMQANRWRVEAHRSFAEHLVESSAQALVSLEAGYSWQGQVPASHSPPTTVDASGGTSLGSSLESTEDAVEGGNAAPASRSDKLHFLSQFGVGLWLSAVASRLASSLQELRLERLDVGVVALQILRRRLRSPMALRVLALSTGCTGLGEKKAGIELAWLVARVTPRLQRLVLAGSDASPSLLQGMLEAISRPPQPAAERAFSTQSPFAMTRPDVLHLRWIDVENVETFLQAATVTGPELLQAFQSNGCFSFQGLRSESQETACPAGLYKVWNQNRSTGGAAWDV